MLCIRQTQFEEFKRSAEKGFVERAIQHLSDFDENGFGVSDEVSRRATVVAGLESARRRGIVNEVGVILFLESRCLLGPRFPEDPEHDWARRLLSAESTNMDRTMQYVRDVAAQKATLVKDE